MFTRNLNWGQPVIRMGDLDLYLESVIEIHHYNSSQTLLQPFALRDDLSFD